MGRPAVLHSISVSLVRAALDEGVTLIDTAASYETESIVGSAIKGRRDRVVVSTKAMIFEEGASPVSTSRLINGSVLRTRVEKSLKALGTDYIDLLHLNGVTTAQYEHCREKLVPALVRLREEGLTRFLCMTERFVTDPKHEMLTRALSDEVWDVVMCRYNYLNQTTARTVLPAAEKQNVGVMCMYAVRGPLARPAAARALIQKLVETGEIDGRSLDQDPLAFLISEGAASSLADAAYRFCRHTPGIDVVLTGTARIICARISARSTRDPCQTACPISCAGRSQTGEP